MKAFKVFAPASVANVACGFDVLGFALDSPGDEIVVSESNTPGVHIKKMDGDQGKLPRDVSKNTATVSAIAYLDFLVKEKIVDVSAGFDFDIRKRMPFGSGLGSSSASAVAGVIAINEIVGKPFQKKDLLRFAMLGEQVADGAWHADNVAPSLLGGIQLVKNNETCEVHRLPSIKGLKAVIIYPQIEVLTKDSRALLNHKIDFKSAIKQSANLASFVHGLYRADLDLISRSLQDLWVEPQRAHLIPQFYATKNAALKAGALGCSISGAGPSIFALCQNNLIAEEVGEAMKAIYDKKKIRSKLFISNINQEGAHRL